tara:strand:+ start:179 stop:463 length:285 start_codon:yes stop_codon:yes gene_type:complete
MLVIFLRAEGMGMLALLSLVSLILRGLRSVVLSISGGRALRVIGKVRGVVVLLWSLAVILLEERIMKDFLFWILRPGMLCLLVRVLGKEAEVLR